MKKALLVALSALTLLAASCSFTASASSTDADRIVKDYDFRAFTDLEVSGDFIVNLSQGSYSVVVDVPEELESYLRVIVKDGELKIGYKDLPLKLRRIINRSEYRSIANISMPDVRELDLSGACDVTALDLDCSSLAVDCSGACSIELSGKFNELDLDCSGAMKAVISGSAREFDMDCSGAVKIDALALVAKEVGVELAGAAAATVTAVKRLDIDISGAAKLEYKVEDDTIMRVETSGAAKIARVQ